MKLFEKFKKKAQVKHKINHSDEDIIADILKKLKLNKNIILKISENKGLAVFKGDFQNQERLYIQIFSSIISTRGEENEYFAEVDFDYLVTIFEDHPDIAFAVLDIFDEKPIYYPRNAFTNRYIIKKNTSIKIGQPSNKPIGLIEIAKKFSKNCEEISAVYLALMENNGSYSFLICIEGGNYEKLSKKFSEFIYENAPDKWLLDNPVDFSEDMLQKYGEEYRIYQK